MSEFQFPVGYHRFHNRQLFNFQLNRWHSLGYTRLQDLEEAGRKVRGFADWKREMLRLADESASENRLMNAAFYCRAAEFYVRSNDPEKEALYDRFIDSFYSAFEKDKIERHRVPYDGAFLSALRIPPAAGTKGTIVIHGGFDSLLEEWYSMMVYFSNHGYEVIGFEGPGQGAALRKCELPFTHEWEGPTKAVLDHFSQLDVTLVGLSMGGWLALRAAAFEPRVRRVIASGHAIDYMKTMPAGFRQIHLWCLQHCRGFMNRMAALKFDNRENVASWAVDHLKYITKREEPLDALEVYVLMNDKNIHCERVTQDVLVMTGREDHFIPFKMHGLQLRALANARSVTGRVFTREEHAQNHCQIGNTGLALDVMAEWISTASQ